MNRYPFDKGFIEAIEQVQGKYDADFVISMLLDDDAKFLKSLEGLEFAISTSQGYMKWLREAPLSEFTNLVEVSPVVPSTTKLVAVEIISLAVCLCLDKDVFAVECTEAGLSTRQANLLRSRNTIHHGAVICSRLWDLARTNADLVLKDPHASDVPISSSSSAPSQPSGSMSVNLTNPSVRKLALSAFSRGDLIEAKRNLEDSVSSNGDWISVNALKESALLDPKASSGNYRKQHICGVILSCAIFSNTSGKCTVDRKGKGILRNSPNCVRYVYATKRN